MRRVPGRGWRVVSWALLAGFLLLPRVGLAQDSTTIAIQKRMGEALAPIPTIPTPWRPRPTWIFIVRHAEKAEGEGDVPLTEQGRERARALASVLSEVPIDAIYSTTWRRNRATAEPVAKAKGLAVAALSTEGGPEAHVKELAALLRDGQHRGDTVLCVEHSNTVPLLLRELGVEDVPDSAQYSQLFVVTPGMTGRQLLILHYGPPEPDQAPR